MSDEKRIVIILYQYSVVVKGMERKLKELGFVVDMLTGNFELMDKLSETTDLFLLYLPSDIVDSKDEKRQLIELCGSAYRNEKKMIIMGENKDHRLLLAEVPSLSEFIWMDKPIDNDKLLGNVGKALSGEVVPSASSDKKRILIVDDDPSYAGIVRGWIKDDYKVDIVTAGMQAITFLLKNPVDLILLDYEMPVVDGPQVLMMLRQEEATSHIPVVFLTGVGTKEGVTRVMALKPDGYILKSTPKDELLGFLKKRLG